jgi:hypothetical protein
VIKASTEREQRLVKQTQDDLMIDFFIVLSASMEEVDPVTLVKVQKLIESAEHAKSN